MKSNLFNGTSKQSFHKQLAGLDGNGGEFGLPVQHVSDRENPRGTDTLLVPTDQLLASEMTDTCRDVPKMRQRRFRKLLGISEYPGFVQIERIRNRISADRHYHLKRERRSSPISLPRLSHSVLPYCIRLRTVPRPWSSR